MNVDQPRAPARCCRSTRRAESARTPAPSASCFTARTVPQSTLGAPIASVSCSRVAGRQRLAPAGGYEVLARVERQVDRVERVRRRRASRGSRRRRPGRLHRQELHHREARARPPSRRSAPDRGSRRRPNPVFDRIENSGIDDAGAAAPPLAPACFADARRAPWPPRAASARRAAGASITSDRVRPCSRARPARRPPCSGSAVSSSHQSRRRRRPLGRQLEGDRPRGARSEHEDAVVDEALAALVDHPACASPPSMKASDEIQGSASRRASSPRRRGAATRCPSSASPRCSRPRRSAAAAAPGAAGAARSAGA